VKQIKCKRGHRVDQLSIENFDAEVILSHSGFAGGSWKPNQVVDLNGDEYIKKVVGHHITNGRFRGQLSKVVYFTNKDRIIPCYNKKIKYNTEKVTFVAEQGKYIEMVH